MYTGNFAFGQYPNLLVAKIETSWQYIIQIFALETFTDKNKNLNIIKSMRLSLPVHPLRPNIFCDVWVIYIAKDAVKESYINSL